MYGRRVGSPREIGRMGARSDGSYYHMFVTYGERSGSLPAARSTLIADDTQLLMGTRHFWADIQCTALQPLAMTEILRRSRGLPLALRFDINKTDSPELLSAWFQGSNAQRVRSMHISNNSPEAQRDLLPLVSILGQQECSALSTLHISTVGSGYTRKNVVLPRTFTDNPLPSLTNLTLSE